MKHTEAFELIFQEKQTEHIYTVTLSVAYPHVLPCYPCCPLWMLEQVSLHFLRDCNRISHSPCCIYPLTLFIYMRVSHNRPECGNILSTVGLVLILCIAAGAQRYHDWSRTGGNLPPAPCGGHKQLLKGGLRGSKFLVNLALFTAQTPFKVPCNVSHFLFICRLSQSSVIARKSERPAMSQP